jgi:hypothetical protein
MRKKNFAAALIKRIGVVLRQIIEKYFAAMNESWRHDLDSWAMLQ